MTRERRTVFGEVAEQYDRARPGYPDELFDAVLHFGAIEPGDRALEIGAGTGKATRGFLACGLAVTALEPSTDMAELLPRSEARVIETTFENWPVEAHAFRLLYAAQSWHWVELAARARRAADALAGGGTIALFWNLPQAFAGSLGREIQAAYTASGDDVDPLSTQWPLDETLGELETSGRFEAVTKQSFTWPQRYTTGEYLELMGTHSSHRMLDDEPRIRLQEVIGEVIDRHGGTVEVEYRTDAYLARRRSLTE